MLSPSSLFPCKIYQLKCPSPPPHPPHTQKFSVKMHPPPLFSHPPGKRLLLLFLFFCPFYNCCIVTMLGPTWHGYTPFPTVLERFQPTLLTALNLSVSTATPLSQVPSHSVLHRDQALQLCSLFFTQLLFLRLLKSTLPFTTYKPMTLNSRNLRPLIKSQISSSSCRSVLMMSKPE